MKRRIRIRRRDGIRQGYWIGRKLRKNYGMGFVHDYSFSSVADKDIKTVKMNPEDFLRTTYDESRLGLIRHGKIPTETFEEYKKDVLSPKNVKFIKSLMKKDKDVSIPFLEFDKWNRPIGHEGRHTSQAAKELGMVTIPVTIERKRYVSEWEKAPPKDVEYHLDIGSYESYPKQPVSQEFVFKSKK